ncbi:MAG TPA: hypothetical protein VGR70_02180 [Stellaceae bacterium]|nr:hypothetical protein [Stellaceae bacterium]
MSKGVTRRLFVAFSVGASAVLHPVPSFSQSGEFCGVINQLNQLAANDFASIRGATRTEHSVKATLSLAGARDCFVLQSAQDGGISYWCYFDIASEQLESSYQTMADKIGKCLPDASSTIEPPSTPAAWIRTDRAEFYLTFNRYDNTLNFSVKKK